MNEDKQSPLKEEQAPKEAKSQKKRKRHQRKPDPRQDKIIKKQSALLERWLFLEEESAFSSLSKPLLLGEHTSVIQLKGINRSTALLHGTLLEWNKDNSQFLLEVDGHSIPLKPNNLSKLLNQLENIREKLIGQRVECVIWPTRGRQKEEHLRFDYDFFRCARVSPLTHPDTKNIVEIVARLTNVWEEGFELKLWSPQRRHFFYTYVTGTYPYPDEKGEFVWVKAHINPEKQTIELQDAQALAFVPQEELPAIQKLLSQKNNPPKRKP